MLGMWYIPFFNEPFLIEFVQLLCWKTEYLQFLLIFILSVNFSSFFLKENLSGIHISSIDDDLASYTRHLSCLVPSLFSFIPLMKQEKPWMLLLMMKRNKSVLRTRSITFNFNQKQEVVFFVAVDVVSFREERTQSVNKHLHNALPFVFNEKKK